MSFLWVTQKRLGALLFLALSLFYGWQIPDIPSLPVDATEAMNARSMPWALAVSGVVLSIVLFLTGGPGEGAVGASVKHAPAGNTLTAVGLLIWTALYANLLGWLGFLIATAVFLLGGFWLLGERRVATLASVALGAAGFLYVLLRFALGVYLPEGSFWAVLTGGVGV